MALGNSSISKSIEEFSCSGYVFSRFLSQVVVTPHVLLEVSGNDETRTNGDRSTGHHHDTSATRRKGVLEQRQGYGHSNTSSTGSTELSWVIRLRVWSC